MLLAQWLCCSGAAVHFCVASVSSKCTCPRLEFSLQRTALLKPASTNLLSDYRSSDLRSLSYLLPLVWSWPQSFLLCIACSVHLTKICLSFTPLLVGNKLVFWCFLQFRHTTYGRTDWQTSYHSVVLPSCQFPCLLAVFTCHHALCSPFFHLTFNNRALTSRSADCLTVAVIMTATVCTFSPSPCYLYRCNVHVISPPSTVSRPSLPLTLSH